jgi:hypothetical protein
VHTAQVFHGGLQEKGNGEEAKKLQKKGRSVGKTDSPLLLQD